MHTNSLQARRTTNHNRRCREILDELRRGGPGTAREIKERLGLADMNDVRPRLTDMGMGNGKMGLVVEVGHKRCEITGKHVSVYGLAHQPLPVPEVAPIFSARNHDDLFDAISGFNRALAHQLAE